MPDPFSRQDSGSDIEYDDSRITEDHRREGLGREQDIDYHRGDRDRGYDARERGSERERESREEREARKARDEIREERRKERERERRLEVRCLKRFSLGLPFAAHYTAPLVAPRWFGHLHSLS